MIFNDRKKRSYWGAEGRNSSWASFSSSQLRWSTVMRVCLCVRRRDEVLTEFCHPGSSMTIMDQLRAEGAEGEQGEEFVCMFRYPRGSPKVNRLPNHPESPVTFLAVECMCSVLHEGPCRPAHVLRLTSMEAQEPLVGYRSRWAEMIEEKYTPPTRKRCDNIENQTKYIIFCISILKSILKMLVQ